MNLIFIFVLVDMPEEISANKSKKLKVVKKTKKNSFGI